MNLRSLIPTGRESAELAWGFEPFRSMQRQMDRLFDEFGGGFPTFAPQTTEQLLPHMDVSETDKAIEITAELPGLEEKDVEVRFSDNVLTISGEKKSEREEKERDFHLVERRYGSFARSIRLPEGTDPAKIEATIDKGVLKVTIEKPAAKLAKTIDVKTAA